MYGNQRILFFMIDDLSKFVSILWVFGYEVFGGEFLYDIINVI